MPIKSCHAKFVLQMRTLLKLSPFSWRAFARSLTLPSRSLSLAAALILGVLAPQVSQATVLPPNGTHSDEVVDLRVQTSIGEVSWKRVFNGSGWRFNRHWDGINASFKPVLTQSTGGGSSQGSSAGGSSESSVCWIWVDEDWQPSDGLATQAPTTITSVSANSYIPSNLAYNQTGQALEASVSSFFSACAAGGGNITSGNGSDITEVFEGYRRQSQLFVGSGGTYIFKNRYVLKKQAIQKLPASSGEPNGTAVSLTNLVSVANGWRWSDRGGDWMEYDDNGRITRYGDKNNNTIWIQRNNAGQISHILDGGASTGSGTSSTSARVAITLHYNPAGFLVQAKDYPQSGNVLDAAPRSVSYQYDTSGRMSAVVDARGFTSTYGYDTKARLTSSTDPLGRTTRMTYENENNSVVQMTAADGGISNYAFSWDDSKKLFYSKMQGPASAAGRRVEDYTHDRAGDLILYELNGRAEMAVKRDPVARTESRTNARGFTTVYTKDEFEQVTQVQHPDGAKRSTQYESRWLKPIQTTDELGVKTLYSYNTAGDLTKKIEAQGTPDERVTDYEVNAAGWPTRITRKGRTEQNGTITPDASWQVEYDAAGQISKTTDPEGNIRSYVYNRLGNLVQYTDPRGKTSTYTYDADGNAISETNALGHTTTYGYDAAGNLTTATDPRGKVTQLSYDTKNRLTKQTNPLGAEYATSYNQQDQVASVTDASGKAMRMQYDALQRLTQATDSKDQVFGMEYTEADGADKNAQRPSKVRYPTFSRVLRYDERERLSLKSEQASSDSRVDSFAYDARSQRKSFTDANGKTKFYSYNAHGQVADVKDSLGNTMRMVYDTRGNTIEVIDPNGRATKMAYDRRNLLTQTTDPVGSITQYAYNENGWLTDITQANGQKVRYGYDDAGRINRQQEFNAQSALVKTTTFTYDAADNLLTWSDGKASATRVYDDADRLSTETVSINNGTNTVNLSHAYTYHGNGQIKTYTGPDAQTISYSFDGAAQLERVDIPAEGSIAMSEWTWAVPKKVLLPGGVEQRLGYDDYLSLTSLKVVSPAQSTVFELQNQFGKLAEIKQTSADGNALSYTYDDAGRLTQVGASAFSGRTETFGLDANSNRLTHNKAGSGTWAYDAANQLTQRPSSSGTTSYQYDASGNLTQKTDSALAEPARTTRYSYDAFNRLSEVTNGAGTLIARYSYDPFDRRHTKQLGPDTSATLTHYLHTDWGILAEANGSGQVQISYGWNPQRDNSVAPLYARVPAKDTAGNPTGNYRYVYYHNDHQGTPQRLTDKAGNILWAADYDAYGRATTKVAASAQLAVTSNLRFPGQYLDAETGLHYNDRRYYDPETGRYTSRDPIGFEGGINLYAYAGASPSRHTDPTGEIIPCLLGNFARCMVVCVGTGAAENYVLGCDEMNWSDAAKDCAKSCLWSMLPVPDPCGKFGKLFGAAVGLASGLANSFPADTLVHTRIQTDSGPQTQLKPISQIQIGDEVLAWDELAAHDQALQAKQASSPREISASSSHIDSAKSYQKVTEVYNTPERIRTLVHLTLDNGQTLTATDGHPFKTDEGWRDAVLLKKGGKLLLKDSSYAAIADIRIEQERITTFNLEVAQLHTFYVGVDGVVVHNGRGGFNPGNNRAGGKQHEKNVTDAVNKQGTNTAVQDRTGIWTPFGWRFPDIRVYDKAGTLVGLLECKKGNSRYHTSQRTKDAWIEMEHGWSTTVVRGL